MKFVFKRCAAALLTGVIAVSICSCASEKNNDTLVNNGQEQNQTADNNENDAVAVKLSDGSVIEFAKKLYDKLTIKLNESDGELIRVYETQSYEQSKTDNKYEAGFIFSIGKCDKDMYHELLLSDIPGMKFIASDGGQYYYSQEPTDVQFYRTGMGSGGVSDDEVDQWSDVCAQCGSIVAGFAEMNGFDGVDSSEAEEYIRNIIVGPWSLDKNKNDFSALREEYGSSMSDYGASMEIRSSGEISYYIGVSGGAGSYTISGSTLEAEITDQNEENQYSVSIQVVSFDGEIVLCMYAGENCIYWTQNNDESTSQPGTDSSETVNGLYDDLISKYRTALTEHWDDIKLEDNNMGTVYAELSEPLKQVGYALMDIDGNGVDELLIGETDGKLIFEAYTLSNGKTEKIFEGWYRNAYYLLDDSSILNVASNSAFNSWYLRLKLEGSELEAQDGILYDYEYDSENPWFSHSNTQWDAYGDAHVSETDAQAKIKEYEDEIISVSMRNFAE